jgi:hypothetical protein
MNLATEATFAIHSDCPHMGKPGYEYTHASFESAMNTHTLCLAMNAHSEIRLRVAVISEYVIVPRQ